jgi:hypothetical protein
LILKINYQNIKAFILQMIMLRLFLMIYIKKIIGEEKIKISELLKKELEGYNESVNNTEKSSEL